MSTVLSTKRRAPRTERRRSKRLILFAKFPVILHTKTSWNENGPPVIGVLTDISRVGLGLIIQSSKIRLGSEVLIALQAGTDSERELVGKVIWSTELPSAGRIIKPDAENVEFFRLGVQLDAEDEEQLEFIDELIKSKA